MATSAPRDAAVPAAQGAPIQQVARTAQPFDQAIANLTDALLAKADLPVSGGRALVIDPLIDRATGAETATTRSIGASIAKRVHDRYSRIELRPFNVATLDERPLAVLGSIAAVAAPGSTMPAAAGRQPTVYRIWAVLADLRTNRVLTREMVWVSADDVDQTPTAFFRDSPAWTPDPVAGAYIRTCSSTAGAPIDPVYLQALRAQALIADAVVAYDTGRYREALARYSDALREPGGEQLRALNGLYLSEQALGQRRAAEMVFARLVDYGLAHDRLAVKFLFRPGTTKLWADSTVNNLYPMWLRQIATQADKRAACLMIGGHTSVSGSAAWNDELSLARAERVQAQLIAIRPPLRDRTRAEGFGSRQPIVGTGTDDVADALDRRVEFKSQPCSVTSAIPAGMTVASRRDAASWR